MRAVDAVMECLKAEGVEVVFGLPGGANLPTYDAIHGGGIRHVLVRHEAGGGHAAEGYARATGRVGVAMGTSGPGATNLVTPIMDAMMDSLPVVFITGQVRTELLGTDGFQEADTIGITMPAVKHSFMITDPARHPAGDPRGLPHRPHRASRTRRRRQSRPTCRRPTSPTRRSRSCTSPATSRRPRATPSRSARPPRRWPPPAGRCSTSVAGRSSATPPRSSSSSPGPATSRSRRRSTASAPSPRPTRSGWACSACTGRARPTTRWTRPTSSSPSARASTTASPARSRSSRHGRSSSTSTSTRRRSPRRSRRTSRSSATPRRCCRA